MKLSKQNILLTIFVIASVVYGYAFVNNLLVLSYFSRVLVVPMLMLYYLTSTNEVNKFFIVALFLVLCSHIFLFGSSELFLILSMVFSIIFVSINMIILSERIGEIKITRFLAITFSLIIVLLAILYIFYKEAGEISWLFYVYGSIIAIYTSFSFYLFYVKRDPSSSLYLIGVVFFILASITRGFIEIDEYNINYKIWNVILYPPFLFFVCEAIIIFDSDKRIKA